MAASRMGQVEKEYGKPIEAVLKDLYRKHGNQTAVANALGISQPTLSLWLTALGLKEKKIVVPRKSRKLRNA